MKSNFIRKKENFVCDVCSAKVIGTGYTNHCPYCLWSKHVDDQIPGDRASQCHGLMAPMGVGLEKGQYYLIHRCQTCGKTTRNKTSPEDNFERILILARYCCGARS